MTKDQKEELKKENIVKHGGDFMWAYHIRSRINEDDFINKMDKFTNNNTNSDDKSNS